MRESQLTDNALFIMPCIRGNESESTTYTSGERPNKDTESSTWYSLAVYWEQVSTGTFRERFRGHSKVKRERMITPVAIRWR